MKNALFSGISGGATKKDSDSDEEEQKAQAPAEPEMNLLDFDAGSQPSTTGDLLGTSDNQPVSSGGGLLDFDTNPKPTENILGSFGISTQPEPTAPVAPTFTPTFKGVVGFTTALFG